MKLLQNFKIVFKRTKSKIVINQKGIFCEDHKNNVIV